VLIEAMLPVSENLPMRNTHRRGQSTLAIYLDVGTTNTRAWLVNDSSVVAKAVRPIGVRDTARDRSKARIHTAVAELIEEMCIEARDSSPSTIPSCVAAAGMSSSPLGLADIPHAAAPAGIRELAASSRWLDLPEVTDLPILLVPGVRSGSMDGSADSVAETDVMRGEETLCIGLTSMGLVQPPAVILNLGSHWKAIAVDSEARISSSITTLSGELIHSAQTQTVLASSVICERPEKLDYQWIEAGMNEQRRSGMPRALFCVRLLELAGQGSPDDRLAFMIGAFVAADLDLFIARGVFAYNTRAVIAGSPALAEAWRSALESMSITASALTPDQVDEAMLGGLRSILLHSYQHG
jgi:2-dehydro-3-deoxygalactonokinase